MLRDIVNAPWYIRNTDLHRDLNMEMVTAVKRRFARKHEARLHQHVNPLNPELNPICYLLALLGAHHFLHVSRIRVILLTFRLLLSV